MRVKLGGKGSSIPDIALPDPTADGAETPIYVQLANGEAFAPADYISLGFTHYEAWVVGAAGGRGSDSSKGYGTGFTFEVSYTEETYPDAIWANVILEKQEAARKANVQTYSGYSALGTPQPPQGVVQWNVGAGGISWILTPAGLAELQNPTHKATINHISNIQAHRDSFFGGAGGGGGVQVMGGRLDSLPVSVPVVVGQVGADGVPGQMVVEGLLTPTPVFQSSSYGKTDGYFSYPAEWTQARWEFEVRFPAVIPSIPNPGYGQDGGYSAFGDIAQASGGKGGGPAMVYETVDWWAFGKRPIFKGFGGAGGIGGRILAGGGAPGSSVSSVKGSNGSWDGSVGSGGGGGRSGHAEDNTANSFSIGAAVAASDGGLGSFSYVDTSLYGARGIVTPGGVGAERGDYIGGGGGSVRLPGQRKFGSKAPGYNPNGAVLVRLSKII